MQAATPAWMMIVVIAGAFLLLLVVVVAVIAAIASKSKAGAGIAIGIVALLLLGVPALLLVGGLLTYTARSAPVTMPPATPYPAPVMVVPAEIQLPDEPEVAEPQAAPEETEPLAEPAAAAGGA